MPPKSSIGSLEDWTATAASLAITAGLLYLEMEAKDRPPTEGKVSKPSKPRKPSIPPVPVANPDKPRGNPHGLPDGEPIRRAMIKAFKDQESTILSWLESIDQDRPPKAIPSMDRWAKDLARTLEPLTLRYREEAGRAILKSLKVDGEAAAKWSPDPKANRDRATFAASSIAATTRDQLAVALAATPSVGGPSEAKGLRGLVAGLWEKFKGVFGRAKEGRAEAIGTTESSTAIHESAIEAGAFAGVTLDKVFGKSWRCDGHPCQICIDNAAAGVIGLDEPFPSGVQGPSQHQNCFCSLVIIELPD